MTRPDVSEVVVPKVAKSPPASFEEALARLMVQFGVVQTAFVYRERDSGVLKISGLGGPDLEDVAKAGWLTNVIHKALCAAGLEAAP